MEKDAPFRQLKNKEGHLGGTLCHQYGKALFPFSKRKAEGFGLPPFCLAKASGLGFIGAASHFISSASWVTPSSFS